MSRDLRVDRWEKTGVLKGLLPHPLLFDLVEERNQLFEFAWFGKEG